MKIIYCIAGTCHSGGMERVLANKANWLVEHGYEVVIVTTDQQGRKPFFPLDARIRCIDLAIGYEENNGRGFLNKLLHYPAKQWKHRRGLERVLREECPDVTVSMFCNDAGFMPELKDNSRKVLEIHFSKFKRLQYGRKGIWRLADQWRSRMDERTVRRFERFVVLTEEDKGYWGNLSNICVIPNARTFNPTQQANLENNIIIAVGRYTHQKGFERLVDAWRLVHETCPQWQLKIIGDGEERDMLQHRIARCGLEQCVTLVPPTDSIEKYYLNASALVLSSRYEGLPMILLEAQAFGLPVVAFRCKCGPADVVTDGVDGFLVEEGDVKALACRLLEMIQNEPLRKQMGAAARRASARYEEETVMQQWVTLFEEVKR